MTSTSSTELSCSECVWNSMDVSPPKFKFLELSSSSASSRRIVKQAITNESSANKFRDLLFLEMVALSRYMDGRKQKYRSDKGFTSIQKINKVVNRIHSVDLKTAASLMKLNLTESFAPSKQLCQWLLIKLKSNGMLLHRLIEYCQYSATKLHHRLQTGHSWIEVTTALSMVSRIWSLANFLLKRSCNSYNKLSSVLDDLPVDPSDRTWSQNAYQFPGDMFHWITESEYSTALSTASDEARKRAEIPYELVQQPYITDLLTETARTEISNIVKPRTSTVEASRVIANINSYSDLKLFLLQEKKFRSCHDKRQKCLSRNMDALQWHMFSKRTVKWLRKLKKDKDNKKLRLRQIRVRLRKWFV